MKAFSQDESMHTVTFISVLPLFILLTLRSIGNLLCTSLAKALRMQYRAGRIPVYWKLWVQLL